ncbi:MAG: hypothetical protein ACLQFR_03065 [Streptosporangiaceae bacterium]
MTAVAPSASDNRQPGKQTAVVPFRQLARVTARQHRTALIWTASLVAVLAIALLATGVALHELAARGGPNWYGATRASVDYGGLSQWFQLVLQVGPLLAGMFLGAPLLPREIENGTAKLAWTQAASRTRWLLAQYLSVASLLVIAALGIGAEFGWWLAPFPHFADLTLSPRSPWGPLLFNLSPLLLAGWVVFAFTLGIFVGAAIRRTVPAIAATFACYGALWYAVSASWRMHYLPPLHRAIAVQFQAGGYGYSAYWGGSWGGPPVIMNSALGWPDGRLLSNAQQLNSAAWMRAHHIIMWLTYQPAGRYHEFQLIELGWLIAASALLVTAAIVLVRRQQA